MKAVVKATGEQIEVYPSLCNGKVISYLYEKEDFGRRIYRPEELEIDVEAMEHDLLAVQKENFDGTDNKGVWVSNFDGCNEINWSEVNWMEVEIRAAYHALSACIIAGKKDAAQSAVYYARQLVQELKK